MNDAMTIGELADAAGISRRAIRFYVQRGLLPAPRGLGRGRHYDHSHLQRLERLRDLQQAGHSLDAIARILDGRAVEPPAAARAKPAMSAELWTRLRLAEGLELHFDTRRHNPPAEVLVELRQVIRRHFGLER